MTSPRLKTSGLTIAATILALSATAPAQASPAYVTSTVNLRAAAGTGNEIVAKIPAGSLVDATNCSEWCEVAWRDKKGFAIATALDLSGRVPAARRTPPRGYADGGYVEDDYVPVGPPVVYGPPPVYYGYGPYWGGGWGYRRWRRW
jgi:uncharacterized protein YraI